MSPAARATAATRSHASETKLLDMTLHDVTSAGVFEGYASLFDRQDLARDVIVPGAFRASLTARGASGVRMLFQHDPAEPLGTWMRIYEDARGLFVRGRLTLDAAKAREVHALMRAGAIDGLSIGFRAVRGVRDKRSGVRRLTEIDLWEISIVTFPMMPGARIEQVKGVEQANGVDHRPYFDGARPRDAALVARLDEATRLIRRQRGWPAGRRRQIAYADV